MDTLTQIDITRTELIRIYQALSFEVRRLDEMAPGHRRQNVIDEARTLKHRIGDELAALKKAESAFPLAHAHN